MGGVRKIVIILQDFAMMSGSPMPKSVLTPAIRTLGNLASGSDTATELVVEAWGVEAFVGLLLKREGAEPSILKVRSVHGANCERS